MENEKIQKIARLHYHGLSDEQWNQLKDTFPYCEIPFIVNHCLEECVNIEEKEIEENILYDDPVSQYQSGKNIGFIRGIKWMINKIKTK